MHHEILQMSTIRVVQKPIYITVSHSKAKPIYKTAFRCLDRY